jgi:peptide/nickel transport system permease protein
MKLSGASRWAACWLVVVVLATVFAAFLAPYDPTEQDRAHPYAPPTRIHFRDRAGTFRMRPFVYGRREAGIRQYEEDRAQVEPVCFFVRGSSYRLLNVFRTDVHLFGLSGPQRITLLGTDGYGRDQFSRWLYGGQVSLLAGLLATGIALSLGLLIGSISGYFGKVTDALLMRLAELFLAVPWLYLLLALRAFLPLRVPPVEAFLLVVAVIGLVGWARPARLIRGVVRSARQQDYVTAARGAGAGHAFLLFHHVVPQTSSVLFTQAALLLPQYILGEVTLSFLGLGVGEPVASWGNLLQSLQQYNVLVSYWWMLIPGLALIPMFWAFSVLADHAQKRVEFPA